MIDSVQGASGALQIGSFYSNFPDLASPNFSNTSPFSNSKQLDPPQQKELEGTATSKSPSPSCSQSSSSSQCCSSGTQQQQQQQQTIAQNNEDPITLREGALKRARSEAELLHTPNQKDGNIISRSMSQKSLFEHHYNNSTDNRPPLPKFGVQESDTLRVKVTYGEEKIRFRMLRSWRFKDLEQEVIKRFHIGEMNGYQLKYLDDDTEWVLLTCDADLEECIDICRSSQRQTIKLSLQVSYSHSRSSVASNGHL